MILQSHPSDTAAWTVISAPSRLLAIPAAEAARFDHLADRVAGSDGFRAALETLVGAGIAGAPSFALIDGDAVALRIVLRGEASIAVTPADSDAAELTVSGAGMATWAERVLEGVSSLRLQVPGSTWTLTLASATAPPIEPVEPTPVIEPVEIVPAETTLVPSSRIDDVPVAAPTPVAPAPIPPARLPSTPLPPVIADPDDGYDFLFGNTIYRTQVGELRIPNPDAERPGDHDGQTMLAEDLGLRGHLPQTLIEQTLIEQTPIEQSPIAGTPSAHPDHSTPSEATVLAPVSATGSSLLVPALPFPPSLPLGPVLQLERTDGNRESLSRPVLIGRAPSASASALPEPRLITIADDKDISRSHVRIAAEGDAVVVTDLASKNGTVITLPGAAPRKLRAGEPTVVLPGTLIDLGGGVSFTVRED